MCGLEVVFYFYHHTQSQQLVQVLCAQLSVGAASGQKTPECSGLPAKALVQDVVMGRKGKTEVGRAWCESHWLGGLGFVSPSPVMECWFLGTDVWPGPLAACVIRRWEAGFQPQAQTQGFL